MKKILLIFALLILVLGGIFAFKTLRQRSISRPSFLPSGSLKIPSSSKIENIPYTYG